MDSCEKKTVQVTSIRGEGGGGGGGLILFDNKVVKCGENHIEAHNH